MDSPAGEDLSWWWRSWSLRSARLDLALASSRAGSRRAASPALGVGGSGAAGHARAVGAAHVSRRCAADLAIPAEAWRQSNTLWIDVPVSGDVKEVVLDPDHKLPLSDRRVHPVEVW